jgi:chemotaxis protein MotB
MLTRILAITGMIAITLTISGCVSKSAFELMEGEATRLETEYNDLQARHNTLRNEKDELRNQKEALELERSELQEDNKQLSLILEAKSDSLSEIISDQRQKIADQQTDYELQIDTLGKKNVELQNELALLGEEKEQQAKEMSSTYEELLDKMKGEIDKGQVTISELKGKLTVNLVDAILFDSGKAKVKADGLVVLQKVIDILKTVTDKAIRIEGHTDNVQISSALARKYPTNWELSAARAINVTRFLQEQGLNPEDLGAVAYGEHKPVADNETEEGKAQNRRIEIVLVAKEE